MRFGRLIALASLAALLAGCRGSETTAQPSTEDAPPGGRATIMGALDFGVLPEASGLVVSRRDPAQLWFVNDAGTSAELVAVGVPDMAMRRIAVTGARNRDWEDLASFTLDGEHWLAIADVGDNGAVRDRVTMYFIPEPAPDAKATERALALWFVYADGPRDVEAVAVDADRDAIYLLSKRTKPPVLYTLPLRASIAAARARQSAIAVPLGAVTSIPSPTALELKLFPRYGKYRDQPTAMDLSYDGRSIALLTYGEAYRIDLSPGQSWLDAMNGPLVPLGMPVLAQPETIAWGPDGGLYASSERQGAPLIHWPAR